jgi:eukaryotic-like serine/threonine-protein kinase
MLVGCPRATLVDDFSQGALSEDAREAMLLHVDHCAECRQTVTELVRTHAEPESAHVGRYRILRTIGVGASGVVYEAFDPVLKRNVALKLLHRAFSGGDERLQREAVVMARIRHRHVVTIFDFGRHLDRWFIAMALVEGHTLRQLIEAAQLPWQRLLEIFTELADGLAAVHRAGLLHRDLKPDNVMVADDGTVFLSDFGLAHSGDDTSLSRSGALLGTPAYMAPEQLRGEAIDARADVFSFCASMFEAFHGIRPFAGSTVTALAASIDAGTPAEGNKRRAPKWIERIILRGLSPRREDRFEDATALLRQLQRRPRRLWLSVFASVAILVSAVAAWPRQARCTSGEHLLQSVWNEASARALDEHLLSVSSPPRLREIARQGFDAFASRFGTSFRESCQAALHGEVSPERLDQRMECLSSYAARAKRLKHELDIADATQAASLVAALPDPSECMNASLMTPLPAAREARARISAIDTRLSDAFVLILTGEPRKSAMLVEDAMDEVRALDYPPLGAKAHATLGRALIYRESDAAMSAFKEAQRLAEIARDPATRAFSLLGRASVLSYAGKLADADDRADDAHAVLATLENRPDLLSMHALVRAKIAQRRGDFALAATHVEEAIIHESMREVGADAGLPPLRIQLCMMQASSHDAKSTVELCEAAISATKQIYGPSSLTMAIGYNGLGIALNDIGKGHDAISSHTRSLEILIGIYGEKSSLLGAVLENRAEAYVALGDDVRATDDLQRASALLRAVHDASHPEVLSVQAALDKLAKRSKRKR